MATRWLIAILALATTPARPQPDSQCASALVREADRITNLRVAHRVPNLYESIPIRLGQTEADGEGVDILETPRFRFETAVVPGDEGGAVSLVTSITHRWPPKAGGRAPTALVMTIERTYFVTSHGAILFDHATRTRHASFRAVRATDRVFGAGKKPTAIPAMTSIPGVPDLVPGLGSPLHAIATWHQMRIAGVSPGTLQAAVIERLVNVRTALELAIAERSGESLESAFLESHTGRYVETVLTQSGHRIADVAFEKLERETWDLIARAGSFADSPVVRGLLTELKTQLLPGETLESIRLPWAARVRMRLEPLP